MTWLLAFVISASWAADACQFLHVVQDQVPTTQIRILDDLIRRARPGCVIERHTQRHPGDLGEGAGRFDAVILHGFAVGDLRVALTGRTVLANDGLLVLIPPDQPAPDAASALARDLGSVDGRAFVVTRPNALIGQVDLLRRGWDQSLAQTLLSAAIFGMHTLHNSRDHHVELIIYPFAAFAVLNAIEALTGDVPHGAVFNRKSARRTGMQIALAFAAGELALILQHGDSKMALVGAGVGAAFAGLSHLWQLRHLRRERGQGVRSWRTKNGEVATADAPLSEALMCQSTLEVL